jgi:hypothetical protein
MTSPETLNTKVTVNKLRFSLVNHTAHYDARFDSYGVLKSGQGAELVLGRLDTRMNNQVLRAYDV